MARRYSHRPLFPNPVVSFFLFWLGYILNGSTLPPSVTFCTARYDSLTLKLTEAYSRATAPCRVLSWCPLSQEGKGRTQGRQGCRTRCGSRSLGMLLAFC